MVTADARARVNLIGEHTDYNGGFVLPMLLDRRTQIELSPRRDDTVRVESGAPETGTATYRLGEEAPSRGWLDYVQGSTALLRADGHTPGGFDAWIDTTIPLGAGLSSSAALVVALLRALRQAFGLRLDDLALALLAQRVENEFVGAHVGVMDPMAIALGRPGAAFFLDTRALTHEHVPLPDAAEVVVIDSGIRRRLADGEYNTRRTECEQGAALLRVASLRDLAVPDLPRVTALPEPLNRRVRHVVTENDRVLQAVAALRSADLPRLGMLFAASHASMRDDYEVSIPEIDLLIDLISREPGMYGARLTGGGFGGSIVALAQRGHGSAAAKRVTAAYQRESGRTATSLEAMNDER